MSDGRYCVRSPSMERDEVFPHQRTRGNRGGDCARKPQGQV